MRRLACLIIPALLVVAPSCKRTHAKVPAWALAVPAESQGAVSGEFSWIVANKDVQGLISQQPFAEQMLDLFIQRAKINPTTETGRLTFHVLKIPNKKNDMGIDSFLIEMDQFKDPKALVAAVAGAFPPEGALRIEGKEWPLFVVMDVDSPQIKAHIRVASDSQGRLWLGDLSALASLSDKGGLPPRPNLIAAAEWINPKAPFQGFFQTEGLLNTLRGQLPGNMAKDIPAGIDVVVWSVTPPPEKGGAYQFELAMSGKPEGITQVAPWLQRLTAAMSAVQGGGSAAPEVLQEKTRVGLRCSLTEEQLKMVMDKLGQPLPKIPAPVKA